jgi:hypothetical protein
VRLAVVFCLLVTSLAQAQEQEQKLLDRLLRPDTSLTNNAQDKEFSAPGATTTKTVHTKSFLFFKRKPEKGFWDTRQVASQEFRTAAAREGKARADLSTRSEIPKASVAYSTPAYQVSESRDAKKSAEVSDFPATRPFLLKGKSQKALSQQDRPLTIDEVRELLNKNK